MASETDRKVHDLAVRRCNHAEEYHKPWNDRYGKLIEFGIDLDHYKSTNSGTKDRRRIKPQTQRQFQSHLRNVAIIMRTPVHFDMHPVQPTADAAAAEVTRRIVENNFHDPHKRYGIVRERMAWSMVAAQRGACAIEWHPKFGVTFRFVDPRRLLTTPGHLDLHDPWNPRLIELVPMRLSQVQAMGKQGWNVPADLEPDNWKPDDVQGSSEDTSRVNLGDDGDNNYPGADEGDGRQDGIVKIAKLWYRDDPLEQSYSRMRPTEMPVGEWFFVDDATGERRTFDPMDPLPPVNETNGMPMRLVTTREEEDKFLRYPKGYLCVVAVNYKGRKPLYEDNWLPAARNPNVEMDAFPYMEPNSMRHPLRKVGMSNTELTKSLVIIDNSSARATYDQMRQTGLIVAAIEGSLRDSQGNQFGLTDEPVQMAWAKNALGLEGMKGIQMPGMNPAMPQYRNMLAEEWAHVSTGALPDRPNQSRDVAFSTVQAMQESGDLPAQILQQSFNQEEGLGGAIVLTLERAYRGDQVVSWVTDQGEYAYSVREDGTPITGADLVPMNVIISSSPAWRQGDVDRVKAYSQLIGQVGAIDPRLLPHMLKEVGASPELIGWAAQLAASQAPPPQAGGPPAPGGKPAMQVVQGQGRQ